MSMGWGNIQRRTPNTEHRMEMSEESEMSEEEGRLLASLDKGMAQLKGGQGVLIDEVRKMVVQWARGDASPSG